MERPLSDSFPFANLLQGSLVLCLLTILAYYPVSKAGFIWDDAEYVTENPAVLTSDGIARIWWEPGACPYYYPTTFSAFWLQHRLWRLNPHGFHAVNVSLHLLNSLLLVLVLRRLRVSGAMLAGLVFAIHPAQVATVAWVTELKNILSGTFYLTALALWLNRSKPGISLPLIVSLIAFLLGMLAKPVICSFPVVLLLLLWWKPGRTIGPVDMGEGTEPSEKIGPRSSISRSLLSILPFFAIGLGVSLFTLYWERTHKIPLDESYDLSFLERILLAGQTFWFYLLKSVWPDPLVALFPRWEIDTGSPVQYAYPAGALLLVAALWIARKRIGRGPFVAVMFFALTLGPLLGFLNFSGMVYSFVFTHHLYHALAGICALVGAGAAHLAARSSPAQRNGLVGLMAGLGAVFLILTWKQAWTYESQRALFVHNVAVTPDNPQVRIALGNALLAEGDKAAALEQLTKALELDPDSPQANFSMATLAASAGHPKKSIDHLERAVEASPTFAGARYNLGWAYLRNGEFPKAEEQFGEIVRLRPGYWSAYLPWAESLEKLHRPEQAEEALLAALEVRPEYPEARRRLALLKLFQGDLSEARSQFQLAVELDPNQAPKWRRELVDSLIETSQSWTAESNTRSVSAVLDWAEELHPDPRQKRRIDLLRSTLAGQGNPGE